MKAFKDVQDKKIKDVMITSSHHQREIDKNEFLRNRTETHHPIVHSEVQKCKKEDLLLKTKLLAQFLLS